MKMFASWLGRAAAGAPGYDPAFPRLIYLLS